MKNSVNTLLLIKFVNLLMIAGKKNVAYKIFNNAIVATSHVKPPCYVGKGGKKINGNPSLLLLQTAIKNVQPSLEGRKCRVGGTTKTVPAIVSNKRGSFLAMRWIIESAKKRKQTSRKSFSQCLTEEFLDAYQKQGRPRQRRDEYHKMCQASRGYLRYRWW